MLREWKIPLLIHQPSYNLLNRWVDKTGLLDALEKNGTGCIVEQLEENVQALNNLRWQ